MGDEVVAALHCTLLHFLLKFSCIGNGRFMKVYALEEVQCESCSGVFEIKGLTERLLDNEEALLVPLFSGGLASNIGAEGRKTSEIAEYAKQAAIFFNRGMQ